MNVLFQLSCLIDMKAYPNVLVPMSRMVDN